MEVSYAHRIIINSICIYIFADIYHIFHLLEQSLYTHEQVQKYTILFRKWDGPNGALGQLAVEPVAREKWFDREHALPLAYLMKMEHMNLKVVL